VLTAADSIAARQAAQCINFPKHVLQCIADLRVYLRNHAEPPVRISDRRLGKAILLLRVAAYAAGSDSVSELDLLLLQHMFWDRDLKTATLIRDWVLQHCVPDPGKNGLGDILVKGAGQKQLNGVYTQDGKRLGRPRYRQIDGAGVILFNGVWELGSHPGGPGSPSWYECLQEENNPEPPMGSWLTSYIAGEPVATLRRAPTCEGTRGAPKDCLPAARFLLHGIRERLTGQNKCRAAFIAKHAT